MSISSSVQYLPVQPPNDTELDVKVKKGVERISENLHISANEPSLALYRLQEHVRRAAPPTVARRHHVTQLHAQLQGVCYDVEYAVGAVHAMSEASPTLTSMQELLKEAIFHRQQLKYEHARRRKQSPSMYKRLSSHLTSLDLPDFPELPDALRETASRMENALHHARVSYDTHHSSTPAAAGGAGGHVASAAGATQTQQQKQPSPTPQLKSAAQQKSPEMKQKQSSIKESQSKQPEAASFSPVQKKEKQPGAKSSQLQSLAESRPEVTVTGTPSKPTSSSSKETSASSSSNPFKRNFKEIPPAQDKTSDQASTCGPIEERDECGVEGTHHAPNTRRTVAVHGVAAADGSSKTSPPDVDPDDEYDCLM